MTVDGKCYTVSRVVLFVKNGVWPVEACHTCDNKRCVDVDHLFDGTTKQNHDDYVSKFGNKYEGFGMAPIYAVSRESGS